MRLPEIGDVSSLRSLGGDVARFPVSPFVPGLPNQSREGLVLAWAMDMWFYSIVSVLCRLGSSHPPAKGFCLLTSIMETIAVVIEMSSAPMDI